jgi:MAF protein
LVLASSSPYRETLLERLRVPFTCHAPDIDEGRLGHETPKEHTLRLALAKARAIQALYPNSLIIGSDQVAVRGDEVIGKPGDHQRAIQQLTRLNGKRIEFLTGLALLNARTGQHQVDCVPYAVYFRTLTEAQIAGYVALERPFDCAGSFKSEGLGAALFEKMEGDDPTALIGLPLIRLTGMLAREGVDVLQPPPA